MHNFLKSKLFGELAQEKFFVSKDKIDSALLYQKDFSAIGKHHLIGEILVSHRYLTQNQANDILDIQKMYSFLQNSELIYK